MQCLIVQHVEPDLGLRNDSILFVNKDEINEFRGPKCRCFMRLHFHLSMSCA